METEMVSEIADMAGALSRLKKELQRYYDEPYLNDTDGKNPWISVKIGNHPTYLRDFVVEFRNDGIRGDVVKFAIRQIKASIRKKEIALKKLMADKNTAE